MSGPNVLRFQNQPSDPIGGLLKGYQEAAQDRSDIGKLTELYKQHEADGQNLYNSIKQTELTPGLSNEIKVKHINQLKEMQKYNDEKTKETRKRLENETIIADLEARRGQEKGSLAAYVDNPKMAEQVSRPSKANAGNQADRPIAPEQQANIDKVVNDPNWEKATQPQRQQMLTRAGVSTANQKPILDAYQTEAEQAYKQHKDTADYDETLHKEAKAAKTQLDALGVVEKAVENVNPYQVANVFKFFGETGKKISDAILTEDQAKIQASIPAFLEGRKELFGVLDYLMLTWHYYLIKLPDIGKSPEANKAIIKLMKKYSRLSIEKEKVGNAIKKKNNGYRPLDYTTQVEDTFHELNKPIKIVPPGKTKPIEIPAFELEAVLKDGAMIYNEL